MTIFDDGAERQLSRTPIRFLADGIPFDADDMEVHVPLPNERLQIKLTSEGLIADLYNPDGSGPQATNSCTYDEFIDLFLGAGVPSNKNIDGIRKAALRAKQRAYRDSNDAELSALKDALNLALAALGIDAGALDDEAFEKENR